MQMYQMVFPVVIARFITKNEKDRKKQIRHFKNEILQIYISLFLYYFLITTKNGILYEY